jgi:pyrimidine-specific ribonucleoside hydrolase
MKHRIHFDMETQDPDDVMTLAILATHPRVELVSVTITPGGPDQVGLARHVLDHLDRKDVPIGGDPSRTKPAVSAFHDKWLGSFSLMPDRYALDVLNYAVDLGATLLTGAPLKNFISLPRFPRWVAQGGFAGDSVVPPEYRLEKFAGRETCPTFNFNGAPKVAEGMLASSHIGEKLLVGKNVCHGVAWDPEFHARVKALPKRTAGLDLVLKGMELYLEKNPDGKKLHDPLAMAVAIEPEICEFQRVDMYRHKGEWGARLNRDSDVKIAIALRDRQRFFEVLTEA